MTKIKHNHAIDALRFFAAASVALFHLNQAIPHVDNWYRNVVKYGHLGVPIFFVISGYCIILSADHQPKPMYFIIKRILRIFPAYWISLILVVIAACFQKYYLGFNAVQNLPRDFISVLCTLTLTTKPLSNIESINWVYWTLSVEIFFYLCVFLLLLLKKEAFIFGLVIISFAPLIGEDNTLRLASVIEQWPAFGLGTALYFLLNKSNQKNLWLYCILFLVNLGNLYVKFLFNAYTIATLLCCLMLILSHFLSAKTNLISRLGTYSYSMYLIHVPVGVFILGVFEPAIAKVNPLYNLFYDLAVFIVLNMISFLMYTYVEKPGMKLRTVIFKKA